MLYARGDSATKYLWRKSWTSVRGENTGHLCRAGCVLQACAPQMPTEDTDTETKHTEECEYPEKLLRKP